MNLKSFLLAGLSLIVLNGLKGCNISTKWIRLSDVGADKIEHYASQKLHERHFSFTFIFTEVHYNNSADCNEVLTQTNQ